MRFYNYEDAEKQVQKDIEAYSEVNAMLPAVRKVIRDFDGKIFNVKLEKALQQIHPRIYVHKRYSSVEVYMYSQFSSNPLTICSSALPGNSYHDNKKHFIQDNKRINADLALQDIEANRAGRLKEIDSWRQFLQNREQISSQLEALRKEIDYITDLIPYKMRDYFGMGYRVTR